LTTYTEKDLKIIDDPIALLQSHPERYLRGATKPTGAFLAEAVMVDIIHLDALPATIERVGEWWFMSSREDWLATAESIPPASLFSRLIPVPARGRYCHRSECVVAAFGDAVVISDQGKIVWIKSDASSHPLPPNSKVKLPIADKGRIVAFKLGT
jgi:hypothetical protein